MKLATRTVEKIWGRTELPAPFGRRLDEPVGEIWFEPPADASALLVKYLFTSQKLSVQVHPADGQAGPGIAGKDECWLVLDAEPGASLAIGFDEAITPDAMRAAALDGSIERLLTWHDVQAGDFFYLPANTVHAIGPGLCLVEVQQNTDITYRLYDYGRPRELHLDDAIAVAKGEVYDDARRRAVASDETVTLVDGPYFRLDQTYGAPSPAILEAHRGDATLLPISGCISTPEVALAPGECAVVPDISEVDFSAAGRTLIATARQG